MAQLISNGFLDFREFDLSSTIDQFSRFRFFNDINVSVDGTEIPGLVGTFAADDVAGWWTGPTSLWDAPNRLIVAGDDVVLDGDGNAVSGWVTGFLGRQTEGSTVYHFELVGFRVGAVAFQNAAMSAGTADDIALLKKALSGADRITGSAQADFAYGWSGNDTLSGKDGNDTLAGDGGADRISGGRGNDRLIGGAGNDRLAGDAGNDRLDGGLGSDTLTGGAGRDSFVFVEGQLAGDSVADFQDGLDMLVLDAQGTDFTVAQALEAATDITGGVRFDLGGGEIITVMGVTKAQLADQIEII